jgi:hypothetical protein
VSPRGYDDGREVLAQGSGAPPRRLHRVLLIGLAAALVAGGYTVTSHQPDPREPDRPAAASSPPQASTTPTSTTRTPARTVPVVAPERRELAGVWLIDRGPSVSWPRAMWLKFRTDGTFTFDPGAALFSGSPWARGRYRLEGGDLTLVVAGGRACRPGDSLSWKVGLTPDDRLVTEHVTDNHGKCRVTRGSAWSARPLADRDIGRVDGIG